MSQIHIPANIEQATQELNGLGALLTAKNWARAAIVYAFTEDRPRGRPRKNMAYDRFSVEEFANKGIVGLTQWRDVEYYRAAWQTAIDDGQAEAVAPGQDVTLPDRVWPPSPRTRDPKDRLRSAIRNNPAEIAEVLAEAEMAEPVAELLADEPGFRFGSLLNEKKRERIERVTPSQPAARNYAVLLSQAANNLIVCLTAEQSGQWAPDSLSEGLLHFIGLALTERRQPDGINPDLFAEIEAHLNQESVR